ncbi:MAG TPA: hypothetical protein VGX95_16605 [Xanthobacteraceae bacterium]|jgi:hypothetical protein|nr:hypothetical protein [Xanthobacteraceae bacterium]
MRTIAAVLVLGLVAAATPALAQRAGENDNGRFIFKEVPDGILRLDGRTGQVSLCSRITEWACRTLADDRTALENEIGRLLDENAALRKQLEEARRAPLPPETVPPAAATPSPPAAAPAPKQGERELTLPSDADLNRMMAFLEKMWRRLLDMAQRSQRELERDRPGVHKNGI